jgi:hypothetical protein
MCDEESIHGCSIMLRQCVSSDYIDVLDDGVRISVVAATNCSC